MNALFKLVLSSILAKRVKFFYLHPRLGGGAQCARELHECNEELFACAPKHILEAIWNGS